MSTFVLVHGAWHGGWCWDKLTPILEAAGHTVMAPDLPGHGADRTPTAEVTLKSYTDRVCQYLDAAPEPAVLVGHSMGGLVISEAAEQRPDKIATLVYLTAFLLRNGEFLLQIAPNDADAIVIPNLIMSDDETSATVKDEAIREAFYGDCTDEDVARAKSLLVPQAAAPFATPLTVTDGKFGRVRRVYIECLADRAISIGVQRQMQQALPCETVISMDTSHSPFLSAPEVLAGHLLSV